MSNESAEPGEEDLNPSQNEDIEGLQQQFEQQQSMIAELKGALQSNKQQFANKEKEIEEYAAKLSNIKSRTKASKHSSRSGGVKRTSNVDTEIEKKEPVQSTSKQMPETYVQEEVAEMTSEKEKKDRKSGKNTEKARLLRKKLEENRLRFEQRGKEISESKKGIEEMVENLRMQLEERDQVIKTLQRGLESSPDTLSKELSTEAVSVSSDINEGEHADKREMYAQIVYKDNKIVELNNRIMELELNILDLQENLKEKDAVIDARTKAITLMSEDMSRKSKTTLDTLDDTREQMRLMQNNFITLEARMKDESEQLKKQLEEKDRKLRYVEESHKKLESVRFELTTCIAELQEKVVHLQTFNSTLSKQLDEKGKGREARGEKQDRVEELLRALDESNRQMLKVKAQHKNKVKSLTKQIESLKKVSESSDEILHLQQRVAELEEDKATEQSWKERIHDLEERVKIQNQDLDSHVRVLSQLESEKLNLLEDLQSERLQISKLETELNSLKSRFSEIENLKVTAEMKAVELEEVIDILTHEKNGLLQENKTLSDDKNEYKQLLDTLQQEKAELLEEITTLQTLVKENNPGDTDSNRSEFQMVSSNNSDEEKWKRLPTPEESLSEEKHMKDSSNVELYVKLLESELEDARRVISEEKDNILDLKLKLEAKEEEIEMHLEVISKLEQLGRDVTSQDDDTGDVNKLSEILKELNEMTGDLDEWKKRCTEVEDRLKVLEDEKISLESKLEEVTNENSLLSAQLNLQKQVSEELVSKLKERNKVISEKDNIIQEFELKVAEKQEDKELLDLSDNSKLNERDGNTEYEIITLREELEHLKKVCSDYEQEIAEKDIDLAQIKTKLEEKQKEKTNLQGKVVGDDESSNLCLQDELKQKETLIEELRSQCEEMRSNLEKRSSNILSESSLEGASENADRHFELDLLLREKVALLSEKETEVEKSNQKIKTLTEKIKKLAVNLKAKTVVLQNLEEKEKSYLENIREKDEILSKINFEKEVMCGEMETWRQQCEEKGRTIVSLTEKMKTDLQLRESRIEELLAQNRELVSMNESLTSDLGIISQKLSAESSHAEDYTRVLTNQISELQQEVNALKSALHNKSEEIDILKMECSKITSFQQAKEFLEECRIENENRIQTLTSEILKKENELADITSKLYDITKAVEMKEQDFEACSVKCRELEQIIVTKDMQVTALEDRISNFENSWSALEAKLQERDAVIESLEQELAKSNSRQQHLEEGLSFIEDRRRSLENKFAALGEQLQESDRIKEAAEEHEGELEYRLAALASSEEILRKRLENLNENNVELSQKISELSLENENLKRNIANADNNFRTANKEIERLTMFESAHHQSLESIEKLEAELKKRTAEFDRTHKENEQQSRQYIETLELDMKNLNQQLETLDNEKRSLMEHCENLNDIKINLEDDIETLQEKIASYQTKILELEGINSQKEFEMESVIAEKQKEAVELNKKIELLEENLQNVLRSHDVNSVSIQTQGGPDSSNDIQLLKSEIETKNKLLAQRESELQSYQNRLLQLQFGQDGGKNLIADEKDQTVMRGELENSIVELQEKLSHKNSQLEELKASLDSAHTEITNLQLQLANSCNQTEEMNNEIHRLEELVKCKDNEMHMKMDQISPSLKSEESTLQPEDNIDYQSQLSALQNKISELHQELIQEKAKNVVSDIVSSAQILASEHKSYVEQKSEHTKVQFSDQIKRVDSSDGKFNVSESGEASSQSLKISNEIDVYSDLSDQRHRETSYSHGQISDNTQELVEKLGDLRAELDFVKNEHSLAIKKIEELQTEINHLHDVEKQLNVVQSEHGVFVGIQDNSEMSNNEQYSKESSVESEKSGEKDIHKVFATCNENEMQFASPNEVQHENMVSVSEVQHVLGSAPDQVDLVEPSWTVEITESEEGWGWGTEEARLEEEHLERQKAALTTTPEQNELQQHILELENKIDVLEKEKNKITDELKASQIRSGKMLKKLKDLKIKNESLMRENQEFVLKKSSEFGSLDLAIEEELKIRIDTLEKELKECKGERDAINSEKEGLQKRIEMLSAVNERLSDREQHGINVEFWQNKTKELNNQIETLQWRIEELMEERETDKSESKTFNLEELQEQIAALAADNEQLQNMLEEQRNLRVAAEAALKDLQQYTSSKEADFLQNTDLKESYDIVCKELSTLRSHTSNDSLIAENAALRENYEVLSRELEQFRSGSNSDLMAAEYSSMRTNYESMYNELEELRSQIDVNNTLHANYESLQMAHDKLINEMNHVQKEYCNLTEKYEAVMKEKGSLENERCEMNKTIQERYELMNQLEREKVELTAKYETISCDVSAMTSELQCLKDEINKYKNMVADMTQEQERLNKENLMLNEKYETLKSSNLRLSDESVEPQSGITVAEEMFRPIQLFSKVDKDTFTESLQSSIAIQSNENRDEGDPKKEILERKIEDLEKENQQKVNEIHVLRDLFACEQNEWGNIEQNLNKKIETLERELEMMQEAVKRESEIRESLILKEHELSNVRSQLSVLDETLTKAQYKVEYLEAQLMQKEEEFQDANRNSENQENMIQQIIASKEQEVNALSERLSTIQQEQEELLSSKEKDIENLKLQIADREIEIENLLKLKDKDLQNLKIQMSETEQKSLALTEEKDKNIEKLQSRLTESNMLVENLSKEMKEKEQQIMDLQEVLEAREDEIREAVLQIRDRNIQIQQLKQTSEDPLSGTSNQLEKLNYQKDNESPLDSSQQSELDMALYMLHQRDVRCEELTLELMQLLEERDTLQLRLSTAIRINEELRSKISKTSNPTSPLRVSTTQTETSTSTDAIDTSERGLAPIDPEPLTVSTTEEPREDLKILADKLSQLHSVDYRRDVTLQDEREQRHSEQLLLLQPRASGVLVESNYTLSRDVQSPSTVLLNWIWGRSTPKVMHI